MNYTLTTLRVVAQKRTEWSPEGRERTIKGFLDELGEVFTDQVIEKLAKDYPSKLESMFVDWAQFAKLRTPEQRVALMVSSVAKAATPIPFAIASVTEDQDLGEIEEAPSNVVSLYQ